MDIFELLAFSLARGASDLHLSAGLPPLLRIHGEMQSTSLPPLAAPQVLAMLHSLMSAQQRTAYDNLGDLDFSYAVEAAGARFRVNAFVQQRGPAAVLRTIPAAIATLADLRLPPLFAELAMRARGLVLVTGPTGSGKSTTLAAMVDHINRHARAHIITVEDPIEFLHAPQLSLVNQREVGAHVRSFDTALRAALREDPDVILVGELRDQETIRLALTAAETGHLVLATLHTASAAKTVDRIVDVFPAGEKDMVRTMLSESLLAVLAQQLVRKADGSGRVAAHEIMLGTPAIRNLIREGKVAQLYSAIQTGAALGMHTMDHALAALVRRQEADPAHARSLAKSPESFNQ